MPKFQPGQSGNPLGRRPGTKTRRTEALERILDGDAEAILNAAVEMAKDKDPTAMRLCLDRLIPVRRDRPISFALPEIETAADLTKATGALLHGVASGEITPSEAVEVAKIIDIHMKAIEGVNSEARIAQAEAQLADSNGGADASEA